MNDAIFFIAARARHARAGHRRVCLPSRPPPFQPRPSPREPFRDAARYAPPRPPAASEYAFRPLSSAMPLEEAREEKEREDTGDICGRADRRVLLISPFTAMAAGDREAFQQAVRRRGMPAAAFPRDNAAAATTLCTAAVPPRRSATTKNVPHAVTAPRHSRVFRRSI